MLGTIRASFGHLVDTKQYQGMSALQEADVVSPADLPAEDLSQRQIKENLERFEHLFGTDEDAFEQPTTSRRELWSYYLYYNGTLNTNRLGHDTYGYQHRG